MTVAPYTRQPALERTSSFEADWLLDPAEIAARIGDTDFVPQGLRGNIAAITAALLYGQEVGLGRMMSLANIAVINGRPTLSAEAQRALILAAGHDIWVEESTATKCTVAGRRRDADEISRVTWTMDDARRANLAGRQNYRLYPRQMLLARASGELAGAIFPDVIGGLVATEVAETLDDTDASNGSAPASPPAPEPKRRTRKRASVTAPATTPDAPAPPAGELPPLPGEQQPQAAAADPPQAAAAAAEPEPMISDNQRRKLHARFREKGIEDRAERLSFCAAVVGHDVPSSTDLTHGEAGQVIDAITMFDRDNPQSWPFPEGF